MICLFNYVLNFGRGFEGYDSVWVGGGGGVGDGAATHGNLI